VDPDNIVKNRLYQGRVDWLTASIIKTSFGYCSALFNGDGELVSFNLPTDRKRAELFISGVQVDAPSVFEKRVKDYFQCLSVSFKNVAVCLDGVSLFRQKVYKALRGVKSGETISYGELAKLAGSPRAGRAVGSAMANNPIPLIIPCHRVIKGDGDLGSFSADGGVDLKKKMLVLEGAV